LFIIAGLVLMGSLRFMSVKNEYIIALFGMFLVQFSIANLSGDIIRNTNMYMLLGSLPLARAYSQRPRGAVSGGVANG
jgi:hypothetical protein